MAELAVDSVLVTGSNRGIGLELVKQMAESSKRPKWIFATCRDPEGPRAQNLRNLASKHQGVKIIPLDICEPSTINAAVLRVTEQLKGNGLNLLINNAGIVKPNRSLDTETAEDMLEAYRTNVVGPLLVTKAFLPLLKKAAQERPQQGMGRNTAAVINISSDAGSITNVLGWENGAVANYRCSKAALNMLTRCQSLSYAEDKILCVALHPGWLQTEMGNTKDFQAPMTVEDGVRCVLNEITCLSEKENGRFLDWNGKVLPY